MLTKTKPICFYKKIDRLPEIPPAGVWNKYLDDAGTIQSLTDVYIRKLDEAVDISRRAQKVQDEVELYEARIAVRNILVSVHINLNFSVFKVSLEYIYLAARACDDRLVGPMHLHQLRESMQRAANAEVERLARRQGFTIAAAI